MSVEKYNTQNIYVNLFTHSFFFIQNFPLLHNFVDSIHLDYIDSRMLKDGPPVSVTFVKSYHRRTAKASVRVDIWLYSMTFTCML